MSNSVPSIQFFEKFSPVGSVDLSFGNYLCSYSNIVTYPLAGIAKRKVERVSETTKHNTMLSEGQPCKIPQLPPPLTGVHKKVVDQLNPKLANFSKPILLAAPILFFSLIGFVVAFACMVSFCPSEDTGIINAPFAAHKEYIKSNNVKCIRGVGYTTTENIVRTVAASTTVVNGTAVATGATTETIVMSSYRPCVVPAHVFSTLGTEFCDGQPEEFFQPLGVTFPLEGCPSTNPGALYGSYYTRYVCPDWGTAFGAALGYAAYVEAFFTVLFISAFLASGLIYPLNKDATIFATAQAAHSYDELGETLASMQKRIDELEKLKGSPEKIQLQDMSLHD